MSLCEGREDRQGEVAPDDARLTESRLRHRRDEVFGAVAVFDVFASLLQRAFLATKIISGLSAANGLRSKLPYSASTAKPHASSIHSISKRKK